MKNLITYLKTLWSWVADSQSTDVSLDCRLTVGSPSGLDAKWKQNPFMRFAVVLTLIFTIGSGNVWGAGTTVTYAQSSSSAASVSSGTAPTGSTVTFSNSYSTKDQVTNGNSMALTLTGYKGYKITAIKLSMHSNAKQGSGTFSAVAGTTTLASISSNTGFKAWYDNTSYGTGYRDVNVTMTNSTYEIKKDEDVVITITCPTGKSNNSLYCQSFTITYEAAGGGCSNAVALSKGTATNGTVNTISSTSVATCGDAASRQVTVTITPADCFDAPSTLNWTKTSGTVSASKQSGPTDNGDGTYSYVYQFAQNNNGAGTFGVTCTAKAAGKTVNFNAGPGSCGTSSLTETCDGSGVTLPAVTATGVCKGWTTFAGWATAAVNDSSTTSVTVYAADSKFVPASNGQTLYAVYSKNKSGGSSSVTIAPEDLDVTSGNAIDGATVGTITFGGAKGGNGTASNVPKYYSGTPTTIRCYASNDFTISSTNTISQIDFTYNGSYTGGTITPSTGSWAATPTTGWQQTWTGSANSITFRIGTTAWRITSIKVTTGGGSTTYYCSDPNCCTPLGTINGSFSFTSVGTTGATANWGWTGATTGISKNILKVYKESDNSLVATIDNISASATSQAITGLQPCTEYYVKLSTVSSGGGYCDGVADQTGASHVTFTTSSYTVTKTGVTNVTAASLSAIPATTCASGFGPITIEAASGYVLPATVTVTGATGSWTQASGSLTISSVTGNVSITITPTAASCASFSFHTGTGEDATVKTTNTTTCFSQVNSSTTWKIDNYVIPADTKFFVGDRGFFYDDNLGSNNSRSAVKTWSQEMFFEYTKVYGDGYRPTVGQATGAIGTLYIWSDNNWNNLHVGFSPQGYVFKLGSTNLSMSGSTTLDADRYWETSVITLTSTDISGNYQTNLYTGSAGGVASNNTQSTAVNTMGVKTNAGDNWRGTAINDGTDANTRGFFRIDIGDGGAKNWHAHWVPTHRVIFHSNYPGGGGPADTYSVDVSVEETNNSIALASAPSAPTGYTFAGWYDAADGGNHITTARTISAGASADIELWAHWNAIDYTVTVNQSPAAGATTTGQTTTAHYGGTINLTTTVPSGYRFVNWTSSDVTITNPTSATTASFTMPAKNVTVTANFQQTHTVDWYVGGSAVGNKLGDDGQTTVVDHGGKISDFPAHDPDGSACDKTFVGWTNTSSYVHGTSPLFNDVAGSPTINANASFYAVFAEVNSVSASLTKMTADDDLEVGDKIVIIAQDTRYGMYQASASSYVSYWTTTDMDGEPSLSEIEADDKKYLDVAAGSASNTWKLGDATNGYLYNASSTNLEFSTTNSSDLTLITWTDDSFTLQAGQYISCRTDITGANANKWRGAGASCDPENDNNCSGTEYYYLYKYVPGGTTYTGHTINCADCGTSVTVSYSTPGSGNTMAVTKNAAAVASGSTVKTCTSQDLTVTLTPATHYDLTGFTATGLTTGTATITPAVGSTLPVSVAQTFTVTVSAGATGTLTLAPTFTAQTPLSITLETHSKGTFTPIGDIYSGESFTFPTVTPSDAECSSFLGWIEGTTWSGDGTETDPTAITGLANYHAAGSSSGTLTTTKTYTAVFGEKDTQVIPAYQKVTSAPSNWSGDYLIVRDANSRAFDGSLSTLDAADNYIEVTISEGSITANSTVNASKWTIAKVGATSNYTIKSASGYYIGRTASSNGLNSSTSEAYTNTLSYSDDHVVITSSGGPTLQMNSGTRFRYYTTSQQALQLYKYNPDAEVVSYTYTTNPACTPRYRVTISSATGGSPEADKTYEHADETITITANPAAGYSFTSWTITKTTGGDNVTSTLLTGDKPTTANTTFTMPAYDITIAATYTKKMVSTLEVKDGATVVSTTTGPVSGTVNISTGANKTLDVVITPSDAYDHSWTATVSAGSTYASITNVTDDGFRVNGLAQGDATITVNAPNDGSAKSVTLTVQVRDIMPEEIILKRDGSNTPIETLIMYYDETNSKGQYVKVNVGYSPANPTNKAFTFSSALTGKVGSHSHAPASGYEVLVANGVTSDAVNCTFTSSADGSVTKVLAVTVLPILSDRFVDYVHGNATQTVSARLSDDRYSIIPDINTPSLSDASDSDPTSEDCETAHYHLVGWLPQTTAEALWAAGTPITDATEGLVRAGESVEATGQTWCAIWAEEAE